MVVQQLLLAEEKRIIGCNGLLEVAVEELGPLAISIHRMWLHVTNQLDSPALCLVLNRCCCLTG